jgi:hypothetical protein
VNQIEIWFGILQLPSRTRACDGLHRWRLEMATHTGRWEPTPFQAPREDILALLVEKFAWTLAPCE